MNDVKSNTVDVDALFGTDETKVAEGVWIDTGAGEVLCSYYDTSNIEVMKAFTEVSKPVKKLMDAKLLTQVQERKLAAQVFIKSSVKSWRGVKVHGEEVPYSPETALDMFLKYPKFMTAVMEGASEIGRFQNREGDAGNS